MHLCFVSVICLLLNHLCADVNKVTVEHLLMEAEASDRLLRCVCVCVHTDLTCSRPAAGQHLSQESEFLPVGTTDEFAHYQHTHTPRVVNNSHFDSTAVVNNSPVPFSVTMETQPNRTLWVLSVCFNPYLILMSLW